MNMNLTLEKAILEKIKTIVIDQLVLILISLEKLCLLDSYLEGDVKIRKLWEELYNEF